MKIGTQDQELSVVGMHIQALFDFQFALGQFIVYQIVFGFLVQAFKLRHYHGDKQFYFFILLIVGICIPKTFISLFILKQTPMNQPLDHHSIHILLIYYQTTFKLIQGQLSMIDLQICQTRKQVLGESWIAGFESVGFGSQFLIESLISFGKEIEFSLMKDIFYSSDRYEIQSLHQSQFFYFLFYSGFGQNLIAFFVKGESR